MQNFLFRLKDGSFIYYFFEAPGKIRYKRFSNKSILDNSVVVINDATGSFAIDIDKWDNSHIVFQNKRGGISYCSFDGENIKNTEMLKSRQNDIYERHFKIMSTGDYINFFYILKKEQQNSLIFHNINIGKMEFSMPKIIGNLFESSLCYDICCDSHENIHVFFPYSDHIQGSTIEYKKLMPSSMLLEESRFFKTATGNVTHITSAIINGFTPIFACRESGTDNGLFSNIIVKNTEITSGGEILVKGVRNNQNLALVVTNHTPLLILQDNRYASIYTVDFNTHVSKPLRKLMITGSKLCRYRSNFPFEEIIINNLPVISGKRISIPLLDKINLEGNYKSAMQKEIQNLSDKIFTLEKLIIEKHQAIDKLNLRIRYLEMQKNKPL